MEAKPDFAGLKAASLQRKSGSPPRGGSTTRSSRLSALASTGSPVKSSGSGAWADDDLDI